MSQTVRALTEPLPFGDREVTDLMYQYFHNLIVTNMQQEAAITAEADVRAKSIELASRRQQPVPE